MTTSQDLLKELEPLIQDGGRDGDPVHLAHLARQLERVGLIESAASAWDRAFGLSPESLDYAQRRASVLDQLALTHNNITFRYIPAGAFEMGSRDGDPDEGPAHTVFLDAFWMAATPLSWDEFVALMDWDPEMRRPRDDGDHDWRYYFHLREDDKIRMQYCEDSTWRAQDWHAHAGMSELFGPVDRDDVPVKYSTKPMVSIAWQDIETACAVGSSDAHRLSLPSEAQWEKAARGGLIGKRFAWGNETPTLEGCDFGHFGLFAIRPSRAMPANGYGLHNVCGGVWEWCRDWYDQDAYTAAARRNPTGPSEGVERVLRGGSWADCLEAVTVTFRMSCSSLSYTAGEWGGHSSPTIGARLSLHRG